jgi:hypothetical protein
MSIVERVAIWQATFQFRCVSKVDIPPTASVQPATASRPASIPVDHAASLRSRKHPRPDQAGRGPSKEVAGMAGDDRVRQTCAYLRMLLLRPGDYRSTWERFAAPTPPEEIDYRAVGRVLAQANGDAGAVPELAAQKALEGEALAPETLAAFVAAFKLRPRHAERLGGLMRGSPAVRVINGDLRLPERLRRADEPLRHETLSLHELHVLGPDGKPAEHQTIQLIRSTVDGLESLPYRFDTDELVVEVVRGGQVGDVYRASDTLFAVDLLLTRPLMRGETALIQMRMNFLYRSAPPPEFRRGVLGSTRDLTLWVSFHPDRLPRRVWQARWDALDHAHIVERELVELDNERSVHSRFDVVERAVVGFYWEFDS